MYDVLYEGTRTNLTEGGDGDPDGLTGRDIKERASELLSLPASPELDLSVESGRPAKRLMEKLGL